MVKTRLDPINRDIDLLLQETLSPEAIVGFLRTTARAELERGQEINRKTLGYVPPHRTTVDGRYDPGMGSTGPSSVIMHEFQLLLELFDWIRMHLIEHSPIGRGPKPQGGRYVQNHAFFADGREVSPGEDPPLDAEEYVFVSVVPYARKIERGLSDQAKDGVYEAVATMASRRFGNVARIRFGYRVPLGGALENWAQTTKQVRIRKNGRPARMTAAQRAQWLRRQPAIVITTGRR